MPDDVAIKVERAEQLVRELASAVDALVADAPTTLIPVRSDPPVLLDGGMVLWGVRAHVPDVDVRTVRAIVGDAINNLRSALEYLARALVLSNGGTPIDGRRGATQFPISSSGPVVVHGGVDAGALALIQSVQPGPDGLDSGHPLAVLHALSIEDKHRAPTVVAAGTGLSCVFVAHATSDQGPYGMLSPLVRWLRDGEWAVMPSLPFPEHADVKIDTTVTTTITREGSGPVMPSIVDEVDYLLRWVRDELIPKFRPYFTEPWNEDVFSPAPVTDPMIAARANAIDADRIMRDTEALHDAFPVGADGEPHLIVLSLAEYVNLDPRLVS